MLPMPSTAARTLADVLDRWSAGAGAEGDAGGPDPPDEGGWLADMGAALDRAARDATRLGRWTPGDPLRLTKATVTWLLRCPRRALAAAGAVATDDLVAGLAVDAAAKLATLVPHRPPTVAEALAYLAATDDGTAADHLADRGPAARPLLDDIAARIERLAVAWPKVDPAWWPRVEEPVRVPLAGGAVTLGGRLDLLLGGPPTARPPVVVEVKGGRWHDGMRADGHLYALAVALREQCPPAAVVTVVADGTTQVEPVRPAVLASAADRVVHALGVAAAIAGGESPAAHAGPHCAHCPLQAGCPACRP